MTLKSRFVFSLLAFAIGAAGLWTVVAPHDPPPNLVHKVPDPRFGTLPLRFERNVGQASTNVSYLARGAGYGLFFNPQNVAVVLNSMHRPQVNEAPGPETQSILRMRWIAANPAPEISGSGHVDGATNYLVGSDPSQWHRDVPTVAQLRYHEVYPGVDLAFYGNQNQLEYDFVVAPGADASTIRLAFEGADRLVIDASGDLVLTIGDQQIVQRAPVVYQKIDGDRRPVDGRYTMTAKNEVAFEIGRYDTTHELVIDPVLFYSSFLGGSGYDYAQAVATDASGNVYIAGYTSSTDFPATSGVYKDTCSNCTSSSFDAVVTKLDANGTRVYSTYVGDNNTSDKARAIAADSSGNVYVTGDTFYGGSGNRFPIVNGFTDPMTAGSGAILFKLNSDGASLAYSTILQSGSTTVGYAIALNGANQVFVAGLTTSSDGKFPLWPTVGAYSTLLGTGGTDDVFVANIDTSKSGVASLNYATRIGGTVSDQAYAVAVNASGNAYITGYTQSTGFPVTSGAYDETCANSCSRDAFVAKLAADGSTLEYSTYLGGTGEEWSYGIALDSAGKAYVTGNTTSTDFPTSAGTYDASFNSVSDAFVAVISSAGTQLVYGTYLGGSNEDVAMGIAVDAGGNFTVVGYTSSDKDAVTPFPLSRAFGTGGAGREAFVTRFMSTGDALVFSTLLGGNGSQDKAFGVAVDAGRNVLVVGQSDSSDLPQTNAFQSGGYGGGLIDGFVAKITDVDLAVGITDSPDPVNTGASLTYTVTITNNGSTRATDVLASVTLPTSVTLDSQSASQGSCTTQLLCSLGSLEPSASATITATVLAGSTAEVITLTSAVVSTETDENSADNSDGEVTTVQVSSDGGGGGGSNSGGGGGGGGSVTPSALLALALAWFGFRIRRRTR